MAHIKSVGQPDDWVHRAVVPLSGEVPLTHTLTPTSGIVRIRITEADGTEKYWNGTAFVESAGIDLPTSIAASVSRYPFTIPEEARGKTIEYEGWVVRNGVRTPSAFAETVVNHADEYDIEL